jgi:hypothetical protein
VDWFQDGLKASLQIRVRSVTSAVEAKLTLYGRSPILELSVADIVRDADGQCDWLRLQSTREPEQQDGGGQHHQSDLKNDHGFVFRPDRGSLASRVRASTGDPARREISSALQPVQDKRNQKQVP